MITEINFATFLYFYSVAIEKCKITYITYICGSHYHLR